VRGHGHYYHTRGERTRDHACSDPSSIGPITPETRGDWREGGREGGWNGMEWNGMEEEIARGLASSVINKPFLEQTRRCPFPRGSPPPLLSSTPSVPKTP